MGRGPLSTCRISTTANNPAPTEPGASATKEATLIQGEMQQRREEVKKLEWVGRSPESSQMRQLAEMAAKVEPLISAGKEPTWKKLQLIMGGKVPRKEFLKVGQMMNP